MVPDGGPQDVRTIEARLGVVPNRDVLNPVVPNRDLMNPVVPNRDGSAMVG
jgi:hypothetical protein